MHSARISVLPSLSLLALSSSLLVVIETDRLVGIAPAVRTNTSILHPAFGGSVRSLQDRKEM